MKSILSYARKPGKTGESKVTIEETQKPATNIFQNEWIWIGTVLLATLMILSSLMFLSERSKELSEKKLNEQRQREVATLDFLKLGKPDVYRLNYSKTLGPDFAQNLAHFEEDESWQGSGYYDYLTFFVFYFLI